MKPLWSPDPARINHAEITRFMHWLQTHKKLLFNTYEELYRWSITFPADFWGFYAIFAQIKFSQAWHEVYIPHQHMMDAQWFVGAKLNFAENLLRYQDEKIAIVSINESGDTQRLTYKALSQEVARCAAALKAEGISVGDRVVGFLPNVTETIIAMLATTAIGAIWSSCSPDFGKEAVYDRFSQITPKLLFATLSYQFKGKKFDCSDTVAHLQESIPTLQKTILISQFETKPYFKNTFAWDKFVAKNFAPKLEYVQLPFNHPIYILFSSGTTGQPKCIVHGAGGTLIQHLKELQLHTNLTREDTLLYYTTCGWMMWNWMVSGLALGVTLVLYEGAPLYPNANRLWDIIARKKVTVFGTSASYLSLLHTHKYETPSEQDLSCLSLILSTGSPLLPEIFSYVYLAIKSDVCLSSISGGTDIISCFALGCPILPVYSGELQCVGLGLAVQVFNDAGEPINGEKGELVCTQAFPSMPLYFWNDDDRLRYHAAYFERFKNVWAHGDYAMLTERHTLIIYGRSDATLKPGGVRIGTAEIYRPLNTVSGVIEGLAVGQNWRGGQRIILFVVLEENLVCDDAMRARIRDAIRSQAGPHHVPAKIIQVADLPHTVNGKLAELAVKQVIEGLPVKNRESLANPESLVLFMDIQELSQN